MSLKLMRLIIKIKKSKQNKYKNKDNKKLKFNSIVKNNVKYSSIKKLFKM